MSPLEETVPGRLYARARVAIRRWLKGEDSPARRPRSQPSVESLEGRELLSLSLVARRAPFPFTTIVQLKATYPDGRSYVGSGAMLDPFHVLTAGHMIYSYLDGGFARRIIAIPKRYGNAAPYGTARMTYERTYSTWVNYDRANPASTSDSAMDIGLITLNRRVGTRTGSMGFGYDDTAGAFPAGLIMNTAGYPATSGYSGRYMYFSAGPIDGVTASGGAICYNFSSITTYKGQSGSPLWMYDASENKRVIYGVVAGGETYSTSQNFATRITQKIFNDLQVWRTSDAAPRRLGMEGLMRMSKAGPVPDHFVPTHQAVRWHVQHAAAGAPLPHHAALTHPLAHHIV